MHLGFFFIWLTNSLPVSLTNLVGHPLSLPSLLYLFLASCMVMDLTVSPIFAFL